MQSIINTVVKLADDTKSDAPSDKDKDYPFTPIEDLIKVDETRKKELMEALKNGDVIEF